MQARTTREPLVPSYVLTSISLLFLSPFRSTPPLSLFFSYPAILLTPVQSYLSSVSVPISDFYHSLSLYTVLFCSPFLSENFARSSVLRSFSLFPTRSSFFIPFPPPLPLISFVYPSCFLVTFLVYFPRVLARSSVLPSSSSAASYLYLRHAFSLSFSSCPDPQLPLPLEFSPFQRSHPPLCRYTLLALRLLPATHSPLSLSLVFSLRLTDASSSSLSLSLISNFVDLLTFFLANRPPLPTTRPQASLRAFLVRQNALAGVPLITV